jgi:hypothetical protein
LRRRKRDTRHSEGDWRDERSRRHDASDAAMPKAACGKIVICLRRFVSRWRGNRRGVIWRQAQCMRAKVKGEFSASCRTGQCATMQSWSRDLRQ